MTKLENSLLGFGPKAAKAIFYSSLTLVLVLSSTLTAAADGFGNSGRQVIYGFGDPTEDLQRDAETFGFVGREFPGHVGIDIEAPAGTPIYAAAAGEVTSPGPVTRESANEVVIIGEGPTDSDLFSYEFLHDIQVVAGDRVRAGQLIGYVSADHDELGGPHLHFGIANSRGHRLFDPAPLLLDTHGLAECVDPARGALSPRDGGYEQNRARRVKSGSLNKPLLLFPVGCFTL